MRSTSLRAGLVLAAVTALTIGVSGIAGAGNAGGDETRGSLALSAVVLGPNETLLFGPADAESLCGGPGYFDNASVSWSIVHDGQSAQNGSAEPDAAGEWESEWTVPPAPTPGAYVIRAHCTQQVDGDGNPSDPFFYAEALVEVVDGEILPIEEPVEELIVEELPPEPVEARPSFTG